jgi:hypothetical protein
VYARGIKTKPTTVSVFVLFASLTERRASERACLLPIIFPSPIAEMISRRLFSSSFAASKLASFRTLFQMGTLQYSFAYPSNCLDYGDKVLYKYKAGLYYTSIVSYFCLSST